MACSSEDGNGDGDAQPLLDVGLADGGQPSSASIVRLRMSGGRVCILYADGRLRCWGISERTDPIDGDERYRYFDVDADRFCGLTRGDRLLCVPQDQVANVEGVDIPSVRQVELSDEGRVCTLGIDGSVACFEGEGSFFGEFVDIPDKSFDSLSVADFFGCGLVDGTGQAECFGVADPPVSSLVGPAPSNLGPFKMVQAGRTSHCGLRRDGTLQCWGSNLSSIRFPPEGLFQSFALQLSSACALTDKGQLSCWGSGEVENVPEGLPAVKLVDAFGSNACAVTMDDRVACWGTSELGEQPPEDLRWQP